MRQLLTACLAIACALGAAPSAAGEGRPLLVGAAEDAVKQATLDGAVAKANLARLAGLNALRITARWSPGRTAVEGGELVALRNAAAAARLTAIRLFVAVYPETGLVTPLTPQARAQFVSYAVSAARALPGVTDFVIGNEPNLDTFWRPQFSWRGTDAAAPTYFNLLAETYDALKAHDPAITVIGGTLAPRGHDRPHAKRKTHSPATFIRHLGEALRRSGRSRPIMDVFSFHPYLERSSLPPSFRHPITPRVIALADYDRLVALLGEAFDGTVQAGSTLPVLYDEFGVQSRIPEEKARHYSNHRTPAAKDAVSEARQAAYYRHALELAACQPTVTGLLFFHVTDEEDLGRWQSGLYYADDTPKASLPAVRDAALAAQAGVLTDCDTVATWPEAKPARR
jgi:hypothetical protein